MYRVSQLIRLHWLLLAATGVLTVYYFVVWRPLTERSSALEQKLNTAWDTLLDVNIRNKTRLGLDFESMTKSMSLAERDVVEVQRATQRAQQRLEISPEIKRHLNQPFQLLDFEQKRNEVMASIQQLAQAKNVTLDRQALAGVPEYLWDARNPALLWGQLEFVYQTLLTALVHSPAAIKSVASVRPPASEQSQENFYDEFSVRIVTTGTMEAAMRFLISLGATADDLKPLGYPEGGQVKPILFVDAILLKRLPSGPNDVYLDLTVSGFVPRDLLQ